jgi:hypothetical protein
MARQDEFTLSCPIPISQYPQILLAHGGGGKLMHQLIEKIFGAAFANEYLNERHDGAVLDLTSRPPTSPPAPPRHGEGSSPFPLREGGGGLGQGWGRGPSRVHHGFVRRAAALLPRRRYRETRCLRHCQ